MMPSENAVSLQPILRDSRARAFTRDAFAFVGLATAVALGAAAVLSALVLLLAGPVDATPAAESAPASRPQPQPASPATAQCVPQSHVKVSFEMAMPNERCHDLMRIPNAPEAIPGPALLPVRAPVAALRRRA
jgi:hypothetical protein